MKYPFTPELLDALPEELAELMRGLEATLLDEICSRLNLADKLNEVTVLDIKALRSHGISLDDIKRAIAETTNVGMDKLNKLLDDVATRNQAYYTELIDAAQVTAPARLIDAQDVDAIRRQTANQFRNITASLGFLVDHGRRALPPAKAYQWALDSALLQVESGAVSYNQAIATAVKQLAESGLKTIEYESGHLDSVDVAARRAVMTGVNQLNQRYFEQSMEYLETDLVEVSAHAGARDTGVGYQNHKSWQGKVYRWKQWREKYPQASKGNYPDFDATCAPGDVQGIGGANCRHRSYSFIEGVSKRTYTDEQLEHIDDGLGCEYEGRKYTAYEATQKQRAIERSIRKQKKLRDAYKAAGLTDEARAANIKLRRLNAKYKEFSRAAGLPEQPERLKVLYADEKSKAIAKTRLRERQAAEMSVRESIRRGDYPLSLNSEKQARHMVNTAPQGRSVITISAEELQKLINDKAGTGDIQLSGKKLEWKNTEIINSDGEIGFTINKKGVIMKTNKIKVHYSKTGTHAVPYSGGK